MSRTTKQQRAWLAQDIFLRDSKIELVRDVLRDLEDAELERDALRNLAEGFASAVESVSWHFENKDKGGQQVPFHGDFVGAWQLPSTWSRLKWWGRAFREVLAKVKP